MKIKMFLFLKGAINTNHESVTGGMSDKLGPIEKRTLTLIPGQDKISHPCAELVTTMGGPQLLRILCDHYIPVYAAAGRLTFVLGQTTLEVWNGVPGDVAIDQKTGRGIREDSTGQMFFCAEDLGIEEMADVITALRTQFITPNTVGAAKVYFRRRSL